MHHHSPHYHTCWFQVTATPQGAQVNWVGLPGCLSAHLWAKCQPACREDNKNNGTLSVINRSHLYSLKSLNPKIPDRTKGFVNLELFI